MIGKICWLKLLAYLKKANMKGIFEKKLMALCKYDVLIVDDMDIFHWLVKK
jgi:DNA replication protein DnaC